MGRIAAYLAITLVLAPPLPAQTEHAPNSSPSNESSPASTTKGGDSSGAEKGNLEVLSDAQGFDLGPYLSKVIQAVRTNWYQLIPLEARSPDLKQGKVAIEFSILRDGNVKELKISQSSDDTSLDYAAWKGIKASVPFAPLPSGFHPPSLALRMNFYYNPPEGVVSTTPKPK